MRKILALSLVTVLLGCAPATRQPVISDTQARKEAEIQRQLAKDWSQEKAPKSQRSRDDYYGRAIDIWYRIGGANAELCGKQVTNTIGALLAVAPKGNSQAEQDFINRYNLSPDHPTVLHVAAGSPSDKAGLKTGDRILLADGRNVRSAEFDRDTRAGRSVRLTALRNGKRTSMTVMPELTCDYGFDVKKKDELNAYATGTLVVIYTGMMDFAKKDEELALVVAHELAHNTMGHIPKKQGNTLLGVLVGTALDAYAGTNVFGDLAGGIGQGAYSQGFEGEADYVGVYYAARAGYDMSDAAGIWRRMGAANPKSIDLAGSSHPSSAKRYLAIEQTAKEIANKRRNKQPLIPDMLDKQ